MLSEEEEDDDDDEEEEDDDIKGGFSIRVNWSGVQNTITRHNNGEESSVCLFGLKTDSEMVSFSLWFIN